MKLRTKIFAPLFVALMLGMATSAYADLACTVTVPNPIARGIVNSHTQQLADLVFTCVGTNATDTTEGSLTIVLPGFTVTTNSTAAPGALAGHNITIINGAPSLAAAIDTSRVDTGTNGVSFANGLIGINIPAMTGVGNPLATCPGPAGCAFAVTNLVVSTAGASTPGQAILAGINIISQAGNTTLTGAPVTVLNTVLPQLNSTTNPPALVANTNPAQFLPDGQNPPVNASCNQACADARARFRVTVTEDHNDAWKSSAQTWGNTVGNPSVNGTNVLLTFSGMLPGSIISNCVIDTAGYAGSTWTLTGSGVAGNNGSTTLVAEITSQAAGNLTTLDTLTISCGTSTANPAYLKGASTGAATTPVTLSFSNFPTGSALSGGNSPAPQNTGGVPRYATTGSTVGPVTVINFIGGATGRTTMLIPFVSASGAAAPPAGTFNTGVAIANTTRDTHFGTDAQGAATDSSGNVAFYFYPGDGSASFTITPSTGCGLQNGVVPAGGLFLCNFSDILKAGNQTGAFSGYVFIQANFSHAHGSAFIYGGGAADRLTSATDVLVISDPITFSRNTNFSILPFAELTSK